MLSDLNKHNIIKMDYQGHTQQEIGDGLLIPRTVIGDFLRKETYGKWWAEYDGTTDVVQKSYKPEDVQISIGGTKIDGYVAGDNLNPWHDTVGHIDVSDFLKRMEEERRQKLMEPKVSGIDFWTGRPIEAYHKEVPVEVPKKERWEMVLGEDNQRILLISDLHIPYHHKDAIAFLQYLKDKYKPTRVICMGDELDKHSLSFHDSDPDLLSAGDELRASLPIIKVLEGMFPVMDIIGSNHGSMIYRKGKANNIPLHYLKPYNEVLEVGEGWVWHDHLTVDLPNGQKLYLTHGKAAKVVQLSQQMGMNSAQGHYHEKFGIEYWGNPTGLYWGLQTGCLIDDTSYAFAYNNTNLKRPIVGTGLVIDSLPILEPMVMDGEGRWIYRNP